jgi:xylan 1,4-beta-xylosidase
MYTQIKISFFVFIASVSLLGAAETLKDSERKYANPIISGFHPDPSVCRVGEDYYLVTSSFEYFPGVPIYHSRDLVNWQQIGHVLDRPSQLDLDGIRASGGIYAATIRYHEGVYYLITTLVGAKKGGNFYVTATDPRGPWSEPHFLPEAPGIDPSLFFDDDGKVYYTGNRHAQNIPADSKLCEIWLREINLKTGEWVGPAEVILTEGALHGANSAEGPHLYKRNGNYYLMIAEGGTGSNHAVTIFRSKSIHGPFEGNKKNPIITHRHLGHDFPIGCVGHADLVETQNGEWWMVLLGVRPYGDFDYNLGRETFLSPVTWEESWPVVNPGFGQITFTGKVPQLKEFPIKKSASLTQFDDKKLGFEWNSIRTPREEFWSLTDRPGWLRLKLRPEKVTEKKCPSIICRRVTEFKFNASTLMNFSPQKEGESAGMVILMNNDFNYRVEVMTQKGIKLIRLTETKSGIEKVITEKNFNSPSVLLKISALSASEYNFDFAENENQWLELKHHVDARVLGRRAAGGFTGTMVGIYASSNGQSSDNFADFDWFEYTTE